MASVFRVGKIASNYTALFICDMQEKFQSTIKYFPQIVQVSNRLLQAARLLDMPVVVTEQYPKGLGKTVKELGIEKYGLKPIVKTQFSMMVNEVEQFLSNCNPPVKSVVLCGIEAHVCVQNTVLALIERGYDVHVVVDSTSSRTMLDRKYAYRRMEQAGAYLTTSESVLLGLVCDANHPRFKDVQKLITEAAPDTGL